MLLDTESGRTPASIKPEEPKRKTMKKKYIQLAIASLLLLGSTTAITSCVGTAYRADKRQDHRDDRQDARQDHREDRQDARSDRW